MKYKKTNNGYIIRLKRGEEIITTLSKFCEEQNILGASIKGIGGVRECEIAYYSFKLQEYLKKQFKASEVIPGEEVFELLNIQGNITLIEGKPFVHLHMLLGDKDMNVFGGHVVSAIVNPTCELFLQELKDESGNKIVLNRKKDNETGLNLIDL